MTALVAVIAQVAFVLTLVVGSATPAAAAACGTGATAGAINVTPLHNAVWYQDASITPAINSHYAGYKITNLTGAAANGLWVKIDTFSAASGATFIGLNSGETGSDQLLNLANGAEDDSYFYLTSSWTGGAGQPSFATGVTADQTHVVHVYDRRPDLAGAVEVCNTSVAYTDMVNTIQAAANKVNNMVATANPPTIGSIMTMTVWGETGTLGAGPALDPRRFDMSPATYSTWPVSSFRLEAAQVDLDLTTTSPSAPAGTKNCDNDPVNGLPIPSPGPTNYDYLKWQFSASASASRCYLAVYTFRIIGTTPTTTPVSPVQEIASGTQTKHTNIDSAYAAIAPIGIAENTLTVGKSASPTLLASTGGTTTYTVTLNAANCITSTPCPATAQVDSIVDTLPAGVTYQAGTSTYNGAAIADPVISGSTLTWVGPFSTPQPGSRNLVFQASVPSGASQKHTNSVVAFIGSTQIDSTLSTSSNSPATVDVYTRPSVTDDSYTATAGQTLNVAAAGVLANDSGVGLAVSTNTNPASGSLTQNADGSLSYTPATGFSGVVTYTYNVTDTWGNSASSPATVTITVNPDAVDDSYNVTSGTTLNVPVLSGVLANDLGTGITVTATGTPTSGSVTIDADGSLSYTPAPGFTGTATVTYTITDTAGNTDTATVTFNVSAPGAPVANDDTYTTPYETQLTVVAPGVLGNDTGTGITVTSNTTPGNGSVTVAADGSLVYQPDPGFTGVDSFDYTITDGFSRTSTATVYVVVGPHAVDDTTSTPAGTPVSGSVTGNDTYPVDSTFAKDTDPADGTATVDAAGNYTYTPDPGFFGVDSFAYTVCLPAPNGTVCDTATVTVTVGPIAEDDTESVQSGGTLSASVVGNDTYPTGSTFSEVTPPSHGSLVFNSDGTYTYTPTGGYSGTDTFTYEVCLPAPNATVCDPATVTITVNGPPVAVDDVATANANTSTVITVLTNDSDPDNDPLTVVSVTQPASGGTVVINPDGTVTYKAPFNFTGYDTFTYTITDGNGGFATATVRVRVSTTGLLLNDRMYQFGIGGTTVNPTYPTYSPNTYDRLTSASALRLNSQVLVIRLRDGFVPALGDQFDIWMAPSVSGAFAQVMGAELPNGRFLDVVYLPDRVRLEVVQGLEVTSTADAVDVNPGDGVCADAAGECTLRAATQEANALSGPQAILLQPRATYTLTITGIDEDASATGDLDLTGPTTIFGQDATIDANHVDRGLHALSGATLNGWRFTVTNGTATAGSIQGAGAVFVQGASVTLNDITMTNSTGLIGGGLGTLTGTTLMNRGTITGNSATTGGGMALFGDTTLDAVTLQGNSATAYGGGLAVGSGGIASLVNTQVRNNSAASGGGGVVTIAPGITTVTQSTFSGNTAPLGGGLAANGTMTLTDVRVTGNSASTGGGIYNLGNLLVNRVTLDANAATADGGAVYNDGTLGLTASTISGNTAPNLSALRHDGGATTLLSTTVTKNTVTAGGALGSFGGTVTLTNSIVADQLSGLACSTGGFTSGGYNAASDGTCGLGGTGDVQTGSPNLGALAVNGGYSPTHKPNVGSPVINTGAPSGCGAKDQRNWARPRGTACEKGAIEV